VYDSTIPCPQINLVETHPHELWLCDRGGGVTVIAIGGAIGKGVFCLQAPNVGWLERNVTYTLEYGIWITEVRSIYLYIQCVPKFLERFCEIIYW
jgi:hypothetical protein